MSTIIHGFSLFFFDGFFLKRTTGKSKNESNTNRNFNLLLANNEWGNYQSAFSARENVGGQNQNEKKRHNVNTHYSLHSESKE